jgi:SAM-dependent methyltransferase
MSEKFDPSWLALREPVDHRSRAAALLGPLREWWRSRRVSSVLDLGSGTGSNLRYLAPQLPGPQRWTLVDHDRELLVRARAPGPDVSVRAVVGDLAVVGLAEAQRADLVTASALLDLVSTEWLEELAAACAGSRCGALFALTYDGSVTWPGRSDPVADSVRDAVNEHQLRDKGTGPAMGPEAGRAAETLFRAKGYRTWLVPSPWVLGPGDAALARALLDGWVAAACEIEPRRADELTQWGDRCHLAAAEAGFELMVGHVDLLALPPESAPS